MVLTAALAVFISFAFRFWGSLHPEPFLIRPFVVLALMLLPVLLMAVVVLSLGFREPVINLFKPEN